MKSAFGKKGPPRSSWDVGASQVRQHQGNGKRNEQGTPREREGDRRRAGEREHVPFATAMGNAAKRDPDA